MDNRKPMEGRHTIRVFGEPQPFPKKDVALVGKRLIPVDHDYRTRKNPITGDVEKFDRGYKRRWMTHVANTVDAYMGMHRLRPFPPGHPIAMGTLFFLTKADSNNTPTPAQPPDEDNLDYAIKNALKSVPAKKGRPSPCPDGILYDDDDQIVWRLLPSGKLWATDDNPPGVIITVQDFFEMHAELGEFDPCPDLARQIAMKGIA